MFAQRYGGWAVVAGASEGLGAAFAEALAARGMNLLLIARRAELLENVCAAVRVRHSVEAQALPLDVASADFPAELANAVNGYDIGVAVFNAAFAPVGPFLATPLEDLQRVVDVNVRGPLVFAHTLAPAMTQRGRGAVVLMASLAGMQGAPRIATYAASKAFNIVLGEGLWHELRAQGVEVLVSCAGAVRTPGYAHTARGDAPGSLDPAAVAERTLRSLGRGPRVIPGVVNRLASFVMGRVLPRRSAIAVMASSTKDLS